MPAILNGRRPGRRGVRIFGGMGIGAAAVEREGPAGGIAWSPGKGSAAGPKQRALAPGLQLPAATGHQ